MWSFEASINGSPFEELGVWLDDPSYDEYVVAETTLVNGIKLAFKFGERSVPNVEIMNVTGLE